MRSEGRRILASFAKFLSQFAFRNMIVPLPKPQTRHSARACAPPPPPSLFGSHTCVFDTTNLYKSLPWFVVFLRYSKSADLRTETKLS